MNHSRHPRRALLALCAAALLPWQAHAQGSWPERPIRLIVPFAAGASTDSVARLLGTKLAARLGQPVVVENKGGAGGAIGTDMVAKAAPDGYTLVFTSTSVVTSAAGSKKSPYDPVKDLTPISEAGSVPFLIAVPNNLPANSLAEFIALARAKPNSMSYGTGGVASITHLATELFASSAKLDLVHVPYKGVAESLPDLIGGRLQLLLPTLAVGVPQIRSGKFRGLAVTSAQRSPFAPELPTAAEAGLPGLQVEAWWGVLGPARMPPAIVKRLNEEINAVLAQPDFKAALGKEGATARASTPEAFGEKVRSEFLRWSRLIKDANIPLE